MIATWAQVKTGDVVLGGDGAEWFVVYVQDAQVGMVCATAAPGGVSTTGAPPPELAVNILHLGPGWSGAASELSAAVATLDAAGLSTELIRESGS